MAVVKIQFIKHAKTLIEYVQREKLAQDPVDACGCGWATADRDFEAIGAAHLRTGTVQAVHVIQSWDCKDSQKLKPVEFNAMGRQMAEEHFPGHAFLVVTHTETGKTHNHIVVCPWASETGKKIEHKKHQLYDLRRISDGLCRSRGLGVLEPSHQDREATLPEVVQKIAKFNGRSFIMDMCQKADFARAWATNYDDYVHMLDVFGIQARVEDKNISYIYSGRSRGKRGSNLGKKYDKPGLEMAFRENDLKFKAHPEFRDVIGHGIAQLCNRPETRESLAQRLKQQAPGVFEEGHNYSAFTKRRRDQPPQPFPHEMELKGSPLPLEQIHRARQGSILAYCEKNDIGLYTATDGQLTMCGRPHVKITDTEWVNKRNRTRGSLIEFVAAHKNMTLLESVAEINKTPSLLRLEQQFGRVERPFTSFYVPKPDRAADTVGLKHLTRLLLDRRVKQDVTRDLLESNQVHVDHQGVIRFFGKGDDGGAWECREGRENTWQEEVKGRIQKPFAAHPTRGRRAAVFLDPFDYMNHVRRDLFRPNSRNEGTLCLLMPDHKAVDDFLSECRGVQELKVVVPPGRRDAKDVVDFFNNLKAKHQDRSISIDLIGTYLIPPGRSCGLSL